MYYFDTASVQQSLYDYLGEFAGDYSIDGIMGALHDYAFQNDRNVTSIDDFECEVFLGILKRCELTEDDICKED